MSSPPRAGLFALLGLTGLTVGGIALAATGKPKRSAVSASDYSASKRQWRQVYGGVAPDASLQPAPWYKVGDLVRIQAPAGETEKGPDEGKTGKVTRILGYYLWLQQPDGQWARDPDTYTIWRYELDQTVDGQPLTVDQKWLRPGTEPLAQKVAQVLAPAATPAVVKAQVAPVTAQQEAAMKLPLYPQGLVVSKGSVKGSVQSIFKDGETYRYKIVAGVGPFTQNYAGTEAEVTNYLAEKTGQKSYGFAFPAGITLQMNQLKLALTERKLDGGKMSYVTDQGVISEPELIIKLYQAQKG